VFPVAVPVSNNFKIDLLYNWLHTRQTVHCQTMYFTIVGQSLMKTVADRHEHAAYHNKH